MIYLFIHQNFPAQYRHLARHLADQPGNTVYYITQPNENWMHGVEKISYRVEPGGRSGRHPLTTDIDEAVRTGAATAETCRQLRNRGLRPDIIIGHAGWGETLFIKDVFPDVPLLTYFEFFYHAQGADVGFDPEFVSIFSDPSRLRTKNAVNLIALDAADWGHTPTHWQRSLYPPEMRHRISVVHEGVDTDEACPNPHAWLRLARSNQVLTRQDEVITYVSRNLEPYRGFHVLMRTLPLILRRRPRAHVIIVGGDGVSYGSPALPGTTYRDMLLRELDGKIDLERVHFLGQVPYAVYLNLLQVSAVHVYLTYPFVLSWSFLEAMSCGCLVVGSATLPVLEVLQDRINGLAVDFFSTTELADRVEEVLDHPDRMQTMRDAARKTAIAQFDLKQRQLPRWKRLLDDLVDGRQPSID
jgi:glycosyltransferase involved in cell wall biosynthesis